MTVREIGAVLVGRRSTARAGPQVAAEMTLYIRHSVESVHRLWHVIALRLLLKAINFSQDQFTMLEHMFKCRFEMAQQVSCKPGVVSAALH